MDLAGRIAAITDKIRTAERKRGSLENSTRLMAAVKERETSEIDAAVSAGIRFVGENKIQEGERHFSAMAPASLSSVRRHFIGRLQSNKAKKAARLFDSIDSVDSVALTGKLEKASEELGVFRECMVEVNMGEEHKGGTAPGALARLCEEIHRSHHLTLTGLMCVPPFFDDPERARPYFRKMRKLFEEVRKDHPEPEKFIYLSMGMSGDFEAAIEEGSNMVRIGTLIFGPRRPR